MSDEINEVAINLSRKISGQMDANLFESIVSLFNRGVLVHYVKEPRMSVDQSRFNLTVEAANGVYFEGRERIIALEQKNTRMHKAIEVMREALGFYGDKGNWFGLDGTEICMSDSEEIKGRFGHRSCGTKARQALSEVEKILGVK